jgi:hypothetical protein
MDSGLLGYYAVFWVSGSRGSFRMSGTTHAWQSITSQKTWILNKIAVGSANINHFDKSEALEYETKTIITSDFIFSLT